MITTSTLLTLAKTETAKKGAEKLLATASKTASGLVKKKLAKWRTVKSIQTLCAKAAMVRYVKTLWHGEKRVDLLSFYHSTRIQFERDGRSYEAEDLSSLGNHRKLVLQGTVGQGKSIFLRYLAWRELARGQSIPVFVELRRLEAGETLESHVLSWLDRLGLAGVDTELLDFLYNRGHLTLLLDGFDEVDDHVRTGLVKTLERLADKYDLLRIVVTSRPQTEIFGSGQFETRYVAKLARDDVSTLLYRLMEEDAEGLVKELGKGKQIVLALLTSPLMVTLLAISFAATNTIPQTVAEFYDRLFMTLLKRHDDLKPGGLRRRRKSELPDSTMERAFNALSYGSCVQRKIEMRRETAVDLAERAVRSAGASCLPEAFLDDVTQITCLMLREGESYRFIHKSVQEYHAAAYIRSLDDSRMRAICDRIRETRDWGHWRQVFRFIGYSDDYRFLRYVIMPDFEEFWARLGDSDPDKVLAYPLAATRILLRGIQTSVDAKSSVVVIRGANNLCSDNDWEADVIAKFDHDKLEHLVKLPGSVVGRFVKKMSDGRTVITFEDLIGTEYPTEEFERTVKRHLEGWRTKFRQVKASVAERERAHARMLEL